MIDKYDFYWDYGDYEIKYNIIEMLDLEIINNYF